MHIDKAKTIAPFALLLSLLLFLTACTESQDSSSATAQQPQQVDADIASIEDYLPLTIGKKEIQIQLALTQTEQSKGLMFRDELPADHGMLFLFRKPEKRSFWMRNTRIPLDIGYITRDGVLREVYQMKPYDESGTPSARTDILMALEMNQGWFLKNGIRPGMEINLDQLRDAIRERGREPILFGLDE